MKTITDDIKLLREQIDQLDQQLQGLFEQRLDLAKQIAIIKQDNNLPMSDFTREAEIIAGIETMATEKLNYLKIYFQAIIAISKRYQTDSFRAIDFRRTLAIKEKIIDPVFSVAALAKADSSPQRVNATIGTLVGEDEKTVAFETVYAIYNSIDNSDKASYAQSFVGNSDFLQSVNSWVLPSDFQRYTATIATSGGTGAVNLVISNTLDYYQTTILPDLAWTSYQLMAEENLLKVENYSLFNENKEFDIDLLLASIKKVAAYQKQVVVVVNDPAHNPSGYSLSDQQWGQLIACINELDKNNFVIINDIAYIDFAAERGANTYMHWFNELKDHCLVAIAFSGSKTLSMYGMRIGACILSGEKTAVESLFMVLEREARAMWSNINNAAMRTFALLQKEHLSEYQKEKKHYFELLQQRAKLFLNQAAACDLPCYPYKSGFFITVVCADNELRDRLFDLLLQRHIYLVKVEKGLRVAICGITLKKVDGLAGLIKESSLAL